MHASRSPAREAHPRSETCGDGCQPLPSLAGTAAVGTSRRSVTHVLRERRKRKEPCALRGRSRHPSKPRRPEHKASPGSHAGHSLACTARKLMGWRRGEPSRPRIDSLRAIPTVTHRPPVCDGPCNRRRNTWRPGSESNRRTRICSPLHDHSATWPVTRMPGQVPKGNPATFDGNRFARPRNNRPRRAGVSENWSGKRDSNSRPRPWQGRALPTELFPREPVMIRAPGVPIKPSEPARPPASGRWPGPAMRHACRQYRTRSSARPRPPARLRRRTNHAGRRPPCRAPTGG